MPSDTVDYVRDLRVILEDPEAVHLELWATDGSVSKSFVECVGEKAPAAWRKEWAWEMLNMIADLQTAKRPPHEIAGVFAKEAREALELAKSEPGRE